MSSKGTIVLKIVILAVAIILIGATFATPLVYRASVALTLARASAHAAEYALVESRDLRAAANHWKESAVRFEEAGRSLRRLSFLRVLPWAGSAFKEGQLALSAASLSTAALSSALQAGAKVYEPLHAQGRLRIGELAPAARAQLLQNLSDAIPPLEDARNSLRLAREIVRRTPEAELLSSFHGEIKEFAARLDVAVGILEDGIPLLEVVPALFGYPESKTYLFLLQNSDELRPTGGFIGTYGILTFEAGHITSFFTDDVYNLDRFVPAARRPFAPEPMKKYLEQPRFYLRDANFDPDFPTSARRILQFYEEERKYGGKASPIATGEALPPDIDGVIAIMPEAIRPLLQITGPLTVQGQTFTADNLTDALEFEVEFGFAQKGVPRTQRKEIISTLGHALIAKLMALPVARWPEVLHLVRTALDEKQILLYTTASELEARLTAHGWTGEIAPTSVDYLAVFDANLFSLKTDPYVTRNIFYKVRSDQLSTIGEVEIVYSYPKAGPVWKTKGYRTWTRVYVPKGSVLRFASGAMKEESSSEAGKVEISQEADKTVFGAFVAVQVGETKRLKFSYRLPEYVKAAIAGDSYELAVQKQPGTPGHSLTVTTDFGKVPKTWSPTGLGTKREGTQLIWQTSLRKDQHFRVEF